MADDTKKRKFKVETTTTAEVSAKSETTEKPSGAGAAVSSDSTQNGETGSSENTSQGSGTNTDIPTTEPIKPVGDNDDQQAAEDDGAQQQNQPDQNKNPKDEANKKPEEDELGKKKPGEEPKTPEDQAKPGEKPAESPNAEPKSPHSGEPAHPEDLNNKPLKLSENDQNAAKDKLKHEAAKKAPQAEEKKVASNLGKKALQAAMQAVKKLAAQALAWLVGAVGWPVIIVIVIIGIIFLILLVIFGGVAAGHINGNGGTSNQQLAKAGSTEVKNIIAAAGQVAGGLSGVNVPNNFHKFDFTSTPENSKIDTDAINQGKIDKRLLEAIHYLTTKHNRIGVSHLVSDYSNMPVDPESSSTSQLSINVSLHKRGMAADVNQIDFVYKALELSQVCTGDDPQMDIVYYSDGMQTTDASTIGDSATPNSVKQTTTSLQDTSTTIGQINTSGLSTATKLQLNSTKNRIDQIGQTMQKDSTSLSDLQKNVIDVKAQLSKMDTAVNSSTLAKAQKDALNAQLKTLNDQLAANAYKFTQLDAVASQMISLVNQANVALQTDTAALQGNIDAVNKQIDSINKVMDQFDGAYGLQNISTLRNLDGLNSALGNINSQITQAISAGNISPELNTALGGSLGSLGGIAGGSNELLRLYCEGGPARAPTKEAIPIKVTWQDSKPSIAHVSSDADESLTTDPRVFYAVYQPQARTKVHQVITELLQFPYDMKNEAEYKVSQLVTFSKDRDVTPFADIMNKLYGLPRPGNVGLFDMQESWAQVHVGF